MKRMIDVMLGDGAGAGRHAALRPARASRKRRFRVWCGLAWRPRAFRTGADASAPGGTKFHRKSKDGSIFHAAIADTEPDGWAKRVIMRDHIKRRQELRREGKEEAQPLNALDYLLAVDDFSRVGALRFRDEEGVFQRAQEEGRRTAPPLIELGHLLSASRAVEANKETAADLAYLRGRGTSLGGMRPKCTVIDEDGSLSHRQVSEHRRRARRYQGRSARSDACQKGRDQCRHGAYRPERRFAGRTRFAASTGKPTGSA